jgi:mannose-6-phosphate isomerase-like protein (cupin superfamily)
MMPTLEMAMTTLIDLNTELAKLKMFRERTPTSTRAEREGSSCRLTPYRDATIFASKSAGKGAWERHPDGDELVHVIDGAATLQIATESESQSFAVSAGMLAIVPKGAWHRFHYPDGVTLLTITPGESEYVRADIEDSLSVEPQRG